MSATVDELLARHRMIVVGGPGGVGKTTTAAAFAAHAAATTDRRVLVLTVDPARRLATALGLQAFGNVERDITASHWAASKRRPKGSLSAAMLDTKASWDALVHRHAPTTDTAAEILANPLYQNITGRFVQSHDYVAMERLHEVERSGRYDLIIIDTPPSRHAVDFLDAPERMADFFSSPLLRLLTAPASSGVSGFMAKPFAAIADKVLGAHFVADIATFFSLMQTMRPGFVQRAEAVGATLISSDTAFVAVTVAAPGPVAEANFFVDALAERSLRLGGVVVNRCLPAMLETRAGHTAAAKMVAQADRLVAEVPVLAAAPADVAAGVLREVGESFTDYARLSDAAALALAELRTDAPVWSVGEVTDDITDLGGVLHIGEQLAKG
ncbi:MAG: AAA family ATPase [Acidimicrobiales bacterium]|nr:AAA family ATPase [Acidimicrobiales bacterium]